MTIGMVKKQRKNLLRSTQRSGKRKRFLLLFFGFISLTIAFVFLSGNRSLLKLHSLYKEKENLEVKKGDLIKQNQELKEEIKKLKNDDQYIEKVAREKYNMKKDGEEVYLIEEK